MNITAITNDPNVKLLVESLNLKETYFDRLIKLEYLCTHEYSNTKIYKEIGTSRLFCKSYKDSWKEYIDEKYVDLPYGTILDYDGKIHMPIQRNTKGFC